MTTIVSIHRQYGGELRLSAGDVMRANANGLTLVFESDEYHGKLFKVRSEVSLFGLDETTAEVLSIVGKLSIGGRKSILPALIEALEGDEAKPEEAS